MSTYQDRAREVVNHIGARYCGNPYCNKEILTPDQALSELASIVEEEKQVDENTSDGYHTFKELYEYRMLYNALLFNEWAAQGKYHVHKSKRHDTGELPFGGGWFVVSAEVLRVSNQQVLSEVN